jgi:hypothetical protein
MSLINEALKKAQNRHGDSTPAAMTTGGPAGIPGPPRKGKTPFGKIVLIVAAIVLLCVLVSVSVTMLLVRRAPPQPLATPQKPGASPFVNVASPPAAPSPAASPGPTPATVPLTSQPVIAGPEPAPVVVAPEPVAAPTIKLGTRIQAFVDRLRVTGIRISDTGNKAILNDHLFRVNDLIEPGLGLRLTGIEPSLLTFTDETGETYLRHF